MPFFFRIDLKFRSLVKPVGSCRLNIRLKRKLEVETLIFKKNMESENPMICIEDLEKNLGNASQRYDLITMVTSKAWIKNGKISVWIEDPQDHGITIMCSFMHSMNPSFIQDGFLRPNW